MKLKKPRGTVSAVCGYCVKWHEVPSSLRNRELRYCIVIKKEVISTYQACKDFTMNKVFWCLRDNCWRDLMACENRVLKKISYKNDKCDENCRQYKKIREAVEFEIENKNDGSLRRRSESAASMDEVDLIEKSNQILKRRICNGEKGEDN